MLRKLTCQGPVGSVQDLMAASSQQPAKTWGPQLYNCKEMNPDNKLKDIGSKFFPPGKPPDGTTALANFLTVAL